MLEMCITEAMQGFVRSLRSNGYSPSTVELYQYVIKNLAKFMDDKLVNKITYADIEDYFVFMREEYEPTRKNHSTDKVSGSTLQNHWKAMRSFFSWSVKFLELRQNPMAGYKLPTNDNPKEIDPFTEEEVKAIAKNSMYQQVEPSNRKSYTARKRMGYRNYAMVLLLLDTGIRIGELCRLNIGDVDLDNNEAFIAPYHNTNRKTKSRIVPLGKSSSHAIWVYITKRVKLENHKEDLKHEPLFVTDRASHRMTVNGARCLLKDIGKDAGVDNCHPHRFRHTFCIEYLRNDGDLVTLQKITGHTTLDMLKKYMKLVTGDSKRVHRRASPADKWGL